MMQRVVNFLIKKTNNFFKAEKNNFFHTTLKFQETKKILHFSLINKSFQKSLNSVFTYYFFRRTLTKLKKTNL